MSKNVPQKIKVVFKPVMISEKKKKLLRRRIVCHDYINNALAGQGCNQYYEYIFVPHGWSQDADRMLRNLSGLFDGVMCWGYVEEIYDDHDEYYNVLFNSNNVEKIGNRVSRAGAQVRKDYKVLYGTDCVLYGLQSIVKPFDFILYNRAYSPNEDAYKDYKIALMTKDEQEVR